MSMYQNWIKEIRAVFEENLDAFLVSRGLEEISCYLSSGISLERTNRSLAVYPTSANGSSFKHENGGAIGRFTVQFYLDSEYSEDSMALAEEYYSALIDFLADNQFGQYSSIDESVIIRMDDGEPVNGAVFLMESRITSLNDFGW